MKRAKFHRGQKRLPDSVDYERWKRALPPWDRPIEEDATPKSADGKIHFQPRGEVSFAPVRGGRCRTTRILTDIVEITLTPA